LRGAGRDTGEFGVHRIAIFRDPDGTTLELIEQPEAPGNPTPPDFGVVYVGVHKWVYA
jgi:hypothetical protein